MRTRTYLLSLAGGVIGLGTFLRLPPLPPTIHLDARLTIETAEKATGLSFPKSNSPALAGFGLEGILFITPPSMYLGFDKPSADMTAAISRQSRFQTVAAFQNLDAAALSPSEIWTSGSSKIYTADPFLYDRYRTEIPRLELNVSLEQVLQHVLSEEGALAIIPVDQITPSLQTLGEPFTVSLWAGWKKSSFPLADRLGLNSKLDEMLATLFKNIRIERVRPLTTLVAVGDIMLAREIGGRLSKKIKKDGSALYPFEGTAEILKKADIATGNLECTISERGTPMPRKDYTFRARPESLAPLVAAGFDVLTMANNHSDDYGSQALTDTLDELKRAGIATIGAGRNRSEAHELKIITTADGTRFGFLGYTMILPPNFRADSKKAGVAWAWDNELPGDIKRARSLCDVLVVQYHWGVEYTANPTEIQRDLARRTIDLGADLVIGHHPHWIQEVEFYKGKFIAYSLGNFVFDMNHRPKVTEGLMLTCAFRDKRLYQVHCDPVSLREGQPEILPWTNPTLRRDKKTILREIYESSGLLKPPAH